MDFNPVGGYRGGFSVVLAVNDNPYATADSEAVKYMNTYSNNFTPNFNNIISMLDNIILSQKAIYNSINSALKAHGTSLELLLQQRNHGTGKLAQENQDQAKTLISDVKKEFEKKSDKINNAQDAMAIEAQHYYDDFKKVLSKLSDTCHKALRANELQELAQLLNETIQTMPVRQQAMANSILQQYNENAPNYDGLIAKLEKYYTSLNGNDLADTAINFQISNEGGEIIINSNKPKQAEQLKEALKSFIIQAKTQAEELGKKGHNANRYRNDPDRLLNFIFSHKVSSKDASSETYITLRKAYDLVVQELSNYYGVDSRYIGDETKEWIQAQITNALKQLRKGKIISEQGQKIDFTIKSLRTPDVEKQIRGTMFEIASNNAPLLVENLADQIAEHMVIGGQNSRVIATLNATLEDKVNKRELTEVESNIKQLVNYTNSHITAKKQKTNMVIGLQTVEDKVDDYYTIKNGTEIYNIAFSDKNYSINKELGIGNIQINGGNLLSNLDLLGKQTFMDGPVSFSRNNLELIFLLLNMSDASYFYNQFQDQKEQLIEYIKALIASNFASMAFNTASFMNLIEINSNSKTLYISTVDQFNLPLYITLQHIRDGLKEFNILQTDNMTGINVQIIPDTGEDADDLWKDSYKKFRGPGKSGLKDIHKDARWNYVASHVASNTQLNVSLNLYEFASHFYK